MNIETYAPSQIKFDGMLKLMNDLEFNYYIHNNTLMKNIDINEILNIYMESQIEIKFTLLVINSEVFYSEGLVNKNNINGTDEWHIGSKNLGEFMFDHTEEKVVLLINILRRT